MHCNLEDLVEEKVLHENNMMLCAEPSEMDVRQPSFLF